MYIFDRNCSQVSVDLGIIKALDIPNNSSCWFGEVALLRGDSFYLLNAGVMELADMRALVSIFGRLSRKFSVKFAKSCKEYFYII